MDSQVVVPVATALIGASVGYLALRRQYRQDRVAGRKDDRVEREKQSVTALDGYDKLVDDLWQEMRRREESFQAEIERKLVAAEADCKIRIESAVGALSYKITELEAKHEALAQEVNGK